MTVPGVTFGLSYDFETEERTGPNEDRKDSTHNYDEHLSVSTSGWVYHPALIEFNLQLKPKWNQNIDELSTGDKRKSRGFSLGVNSSATILSKKPYAFNIFTGHSTSTVSSSFAQRSRREGYSYGASMRLDKLVFPGQIRYTHTETEQTGAVDTDRERDRYELNARFNRFVGQSRFKASYSEDKNTHRGRTIVRSRTGVLFNNEYALKENGVTGALRSRFRFRDVGGGTVGITSYSLSENLSLNHGNNVSTNYLMSYNVSDRDDSKSDTGNISFKLRHKLYENLGTTLSAITRRSRSDELDVNEYTGGVGIGYDRRIPWGNVNVSMGQRYTLNEVDKKDDFAQVTGERVVLTTGEVSMLKERFIDAGFIDVFDELRLNPKYEQGIDYIIIQENDEVFLECVTPSRLNDDLDCSNGAPVVVDYRFSSPGVDSAYYSRNYGLKLTLGPYFSTYYRFGRSTRRFVSDIAPREPSRSQTRTIGADINLKRSTTSITYTKRDLSSPFEEWKIKERITARPTQKIFLSLNGNYSAIKWETGGESYYEYISGTMQFFITRRSRLTIQGFGEQVSGDFDDRLNFGFSALYEMRLRRLRGTVGYQYRDEKDNENFERTKNHSFFVGVETMRF
jgi:hypothetical protein